MFSRLILITCVISGTLILSCSKKSDFVQVSGTLHYADTCIQSLDTILSKRLVNIIRDSVALDTLLTHRCTSLPEIDFVTQDLIAMYAEGKGCMVEFNPILFRNTGNDELTYHVGIKEYDTCKVIHTSWNLLVIPKIDSTDKIKYNRGKLP